MIKKNVQAYLINNKSNIKYLSNFTGSSGFMLLTKSKNYLFTDFRYLQRAKESMKKGLEIVDIKNDQLTNILKKHRVETLGIEESELTIAGFKRLKKNIKMKMKFTDISGFVEKKREIKSVNEIFLIEKSQEINEKVFLEIKKIIQDARRKNFNPSEAELAWKIKELGHQYGAEDVSFDPIVAFGKNTAIPHHDPGLTKLKKTDIVLIDMGMKYQGYCSDMTRMILPEKPSSKQLKVYNLVLEAQENGIKHIKAGISGQKADALSRKIIVAAGFGDAYGHAGGHGIGLDIHESPALSEKYQKSIHANTVITVEPGIYLPGEFGIRIEDMVLVNKKGNRNLTKISKKIN